MLALVRTAGPTRLDKSEDGGATVVLLERARRLRMSATNVHPLVANAYRRRAAELTVAAWVGAIRSGVNEPASVIDVAFARGGGPSSPDAA
jgi:hypothetical protein